MNLDVIHWQATVGQTNVYESSEEFGWMIKLSKKPFPTFIFSTSKKMLAASRALRLPLRSRGCLVSPVL